MLSTISLLTALGFAAVYPLCFWISCRDPLKNNFHKFHIGLPNTVGGIVLVVVWTLDIPPHLKLAVTVWKAVFISVSSYSWKKTHPDPMLMTLPCMLGMVAFVLLQAHFTGVNWTYAFAGLLGAMIFCASLFAMNLGHWYLNVHGLPIGHLKRAVYVFWWLVGLRAAWDIFMLVNGNVVYGGETESLTRFIMRIDGFLMVIGPFFGTLVPLICLYFVKEVLRLKNTQSATGILYVILCSVLIGDIANKYYLIKYGIGL